MMLQVFKKSAISNNAKVGAVINNNSDSLLESPASYVKIYNAYSNSAENAQIRYAANLG